MGLVGIFTYTFTIKEIHPFHVGQANLGDLVDLGSVPSQLTSKSQSLKMDGWNTIVSYQNGLFSGAIAVSFREG